MRLCSDASESRRRPPGSAAPRLRRPRPCSPRRARARGRPPPSSACATLTLRLHDSASARARAVAGTPCCPRRARRTRVSSSIGLLRGELRVARVATGSPTGAPRAAPGRVRSPPTRPPRSTIGRNRRRSTTFTSGSSPSGPGAPRRSSDMPCRDLRPRTNHTLGLSNVFTRCRTPRATVSLGPAPCFPQRSAQDRAALPEAPRPSRRAIADLHPRGAQAVEEQPPLRRRRRPAAAPGRSPAATGGAPDAGLEERLARLVALRSVLHLPPPRRVSATGCGVVHPSRCSSAIATGRGRWSGGASGVTRDRGSCRPRHLRPTAASSPPPRPPRRSAAAPPSRRASRGAAGPPRRARSCASRTTTGPRDRPRARSALR